MLVTRCNIIVWLTAVDLTASSWRLYKLEHPGWKPQKIDHYLASAYPMNSIVYSCQRCARGKNGRIQWNVHCNVHSSGHCAVRPMAIRGRTAHPWHSTPLEPHLNGATFLLQTRASVYFGLCDSNLNKSDRIFGFEDGTRYVRVHQLCPTGGLCATIPFHPTRGTVLSNIQL